MRIEMHRQCEGEKCDEKCDEKCGEKCGGKAGGHPVRSPPVSRTQRSLRKY